MGGENGKLSFELLAVARGTLGRVTGAKDERLELVVTFLAGVFENRHS
jgi:hypothetical protein